jgi:hypothetical protein
MPEFACPRADWGHERTNPLRGLGDASALAPQSADDQTKGNAGPATRRSKLTDRSAFRDEVAGAIDEARRYLKQTEKRRLEPQ